MDFWGIVAAFGSLGLVLGGIVAWLLRNESRISKLEQWKTDQDRKGNSWESST